MIGFNRPFMSGDEFHNIRQAYNAFQLAGDGPFTKACEEWLKNNTQSAGVLLTHSCTAALEMSALLSNICAGDEVIMPSYTFVSTANAFVLRGAVPKFVDIRLDTLNIDEKKIKQHITERTKAIVPVHYAGVGADMDVINSVATSHNLVVVEDAAQGIFAKYKNKPLGSIGDFGAYSFHETKNIISGEGGCILINRPDLVERAEIIREKGTDRSKFFRGEIDKYSWTDIGSSYLPGEIIAAFLNAQLDHSESITKRRLKIWDYYFKAFEPLEQLGLIKRPQIPSYCEHNAHIFYLILNDSEKRDTFIMKMKECGIQCLFHYIPLHLSAYYKTLCQDDIYLPCTELAANSIVRLPLWLGVENHQDYIIESAFNILHNHLV